MKRSETIIIESVLYQDLFGTNPSLAKEYGTTEITIQFLKKKKELVDFMSYDARKDIFRCYEIKVSMNDFRSKAAKSWYGNYNYLVLSRDLYMQQSLENWKEPVPKHVGIIFVNVDAEYKHKKVVKRPEYIDVPKEEKELLKRSLIRTLFYQNDKNRKKE